MPTRFMFTFVKWTHDQHHTLFYIITYSLLRGSLSRFRQRNTVVVFGEIWSMCWCALQSTLLFIQFLWTNIICYKIKIMPQKRLFEEMHFLIYCYPHNVFNINCQIVQDNYVSIESVYWGMQSWCFMSPKSMCTWMFYTLRKTRTSHQTMVHVGEQNAR